MAVPLFEGFRKRHVRVDLSTLLASGFALLDIC